MPKGQGGRGGSLASGGRYLTGGSAASAGSPSGSGGRSGGGTSAEAGDKGSSDAGAAGTGGIPDSVLARASVVLHYRPDPEPASTSRIFMRLYLENRAPDPLRLANVTVRYWMTSEVGAPNLQSFYRGANVTGQAQAYVELPEPHVAITFQGNTIPRGSELNSSEFQLQIDGGAYDQSDDYSWEPAFSAAVGPHHKITVYLAEHLIWGCEPSGTCASGGAGGAGSVGGQGNGGSAGSAGSAGEAGSAGQDGAGGTTGGAPGGGGEGG